MRWLFILMVAATVAETLVSLAVLPDRVAIHFGADGLANGWGSNSVNALLMTATHVFLFCVLYFAAHLVTVIPPRFINLPNKEYWLSPANRVAAREKIKRFMWRFGVAIFTFFFVTGLLSLQANLVTPARLNLRVFFPALGLFLLYTLWWTMSLYRAFRLPGGERSQECPG